jgi:hypothetical protein
MHSIYATIILVSRVPAYHRGYDNRSHPPVFFRSLFLEIQVVLLVAT